MNLLRENEELASRRVDIRRNLIEYLRTGFPYRMHWQHPLTTEIHPYERIEQAVLMVRKHYPKQYRVLWAIWMSPDRWRSVCESLGVSPRRLSDYFAEAMDHLVFWLYNAGTFMPLDEDYDEQSDG